MTEPTAADEPDAVGPLQRPLEALLFLSSEPVAIPDLAEAVEAPEEEVIAALKRLEAAYEREGRGIVLKRVAGGVALASSPEAEQAARRLFARPRTPPLTPAQAETLAIVAYLRPVSRPEIARIRGVASESAVATLVERGLIEEAGRSQFGAVLYRTTDLFLRLFGLDSVKDLPDPAQWDPSPEEEGELRERLLKAGEARSGMPVQSAEGAGPAPVSGDASAEPEDAEPVAAPGEEAEATEPEGAAVVAEPVAPARPGVIPFAGGADPA